MKNMLVLTDFGETAAHALDYTIAIAAHAQCEQLFILNSYHIVPLYDSAEGGTMALTMQDAEEKENQHRHLLVQAAKHAQQQLPHATVTPVLITGDLPATVNTLCREKNISLVVMGIKNKTELENFVLGNHTYSAIEKIKAPLLIVPKNAPVQLPQMVVMAVDFNKMSSSNVITRLQPIIASLKTRISGIHKKQKMYTDEQRDAFLYHLKKYLPEHTCDITLLPAEDDLYDALRRKAAPNTAYWIMAAHKTRNFFTGIFNKSITREIAWHSLVPVLVFHTD